MRIFELFFFFISHGLLVNYFYKNVSSLSLSSFSACLPALVPGLCLVVVTPPVFEVIPGTKKVNEL